MDESQIGGENDQSDISLGSPHFRHTTGLRFSLVCSRALAGKDVSPAQVRFREPEAASGRRQGCTNTVLISPPIKACDARRARPF